MARSPSSAIAIINEMRAKGRFTRTAISVTVIKDVLVILLFAICLSVANNLVEGVELNYVFLIELAVELSVTFVIGILLAKDFWISIFISITSIH